MSSFRVMPQQQQHGKPTMTSHAAPFSPPWSHSPPPSLPPSLTTPIPTTKKYTRIGRLLQWVHILLSLLTFFAGITITALAGVSLHTYYHSYHKTSGWQLPVWPSSLDLAPTRLSIAVGVLILVVSAGYIGVAFAPLKSKHTTLPPIALATSLFSFLLLFITSLYIGILSSHLAPSSSKGTLQTWTCKFRSISLLLPSASTTDGGHSAIPSGFNHICNHESGSYDLIVVVLILEFFKVVGAGVGVLCMRKHVRLGKERALSKVELVEGRV